MRNISIGLLAMLVVLLPLFGCSDTAEPFSAPQEKMTTLAGEGIIKPLHFVMEFDPDTETVTIKPAVSEREADWDVTPWAEIVVYDTEWVPSERNWYVSAQLKNTSMLTGYGVWVVFTQLGQKVLRNVDGFIWHGPQMDRVPFIALSKEAENRKFPGLATENHTFVIHWPQEVHSWAPIEFYIDANWPNPRKTPMVEDLTQVNFTPPCYHYAVRANVQDHQSPSADLNVWVNLSSYGAGDHVQMFDDGEHADLDAGDGIFAAEFDAGSIFGKYTFTVHANDPQGNNMENDLAFYPIEFPPMPPILWETIEEGSQSGIHEEYFDVITDDDTWTSFWDDHGSNMFPPPPKPVIDFDQYMVAAVMIGPRSNSCFDAEITFVTYSSENCGIMVDYKEVVPDIGCPCFSVITYPYHFIQVPKSQFEYGFQGVIEPLICDGCLDFTEIEEGSQCNMDGAQEWLIENQGDLDSLYILLFGPAKPVPIVDFDQKVVVAITYGEQNSSGHYITMNDICEDIDGNYIVDYNRLDPGASCIVMWVITKPYIIIEVDKNPAPILFKANDVVYQCY